MPKIKVAICDEDNRYRDRFAEYLMNYKAKEMDLSVFTEGKFLMDALSVDNYGLIVLGCGYDALLPKLENKEIPILVLTDMSKSMVKESVDYEEIYTFIPKYQSMEEITRQMYLLVEPETESMSQMIAKVIGVISPIRDEMQLPFSLLLCKNLAEQEKVLYLNLTEFSGFYELFEERQYNLTDVILSIRSTNEGPTHLAECIYEKEGFSYIGPPINPEDYKDITGQELIHIIRYTIQKLGYETIVIDIGSVIKDFPKLLMECTSIYCISKNSGLFAAPQRQFISYIRQALGETILDKIKEIELPGGSKSLHYGEHLLEKLNWSELGDYVRGLIRG